MNDKLSDFEDVPDADLVTDLAGRFLQAADAAGKQALNYPQSNIFISVGRYRDFQRRAANITGSLLDELDPADLETAAEVLGSHDLVDEIQSRRDENERKREELADARMATALSKARSDAAFAEAVAEQKEVERRREANAKEYQRVLAARQAKDDLQRADVLERQAQTFVRTAYDDDADTVALVRKAKVLREEAASLRQNAGQR
jgi:hypothetical protein